MKSLINWWNSRGEIVTPFTAKRQPVAITATSKLYILKVDFQLTREKLDEIDSGLEPLREKYGLDFLLIEPGMKLSRFDDI